MRSSPSGSHPAQARRIMSPGLFGVRVEREQMLPSGAWQRLKEMAFCGLLTVPFHSGILSLTTSVLPGMSNGENPIFICLCTLFGLLCQTKV